MFCNGILKVASSFNQRTLEHVIKESANKTWNKLFVFSEQKLHPRVITCIYSNRHYNCPDVYVLCAGIPLDKYNLQDDIDVYMSPNEEDQQSFKDLQSQFTHWKKTKFVHLPFDIVDETTTEIQTFENGVLGGTFDDLHLGHKVLLTVAGTISNRRLLIGIAHDDLLKNKTLVEVLAPYSVRESRVRDFLQLINPLLNVETVSISDAIGPSGTDDNLQVLIVSKETEGGIKFVNDARVKNNLNILDSCIVDLVLDKDVDTKVSSTNTRKEVLGKIRPHGHMSWLRRGSLIATKLPYVIGLTGGICSGKSTVAQYLKEKEVTVIDCDKLGHIAYLPDGPAYKPLIEAFGDGIVSHDGTIDRKTLGGMVFGKTENMNTLTGIIWPCIANLAKQMILESRTEIAVVEAAVLFEAGWEDFMDEVWVMIVSPEEAILRLSERNGLSKEAAQSRLKSQLSNIERCSKADVIFSSQWDVNYTRKQIDQAWGELLDRLYYFKTCSHGRDIEDVWEQLCALVCHKTAENSWIHEICRSESSTNFLRNALNFVDETRHLSKEKWVILTTGYFFLATKLHVQNSSLRAFEAMFHMFKEKNNIKQHIADEVLVNIKLGVTFERKFMPCSEFNLLFRDIWLASDIFTADEDDQIILPSVLSAEHVVKEKRLVKIAYLDGLMDSSRFVFRSDWFREKEEDRARDKIICELERLRGRG